MSLSHLLKKKNKPKLARAASADAGTGPSSENYNESAHSQQKSAETTSHRWGRKSSYADAHLSSSLPTRTSASPLKSTAENATTEAGEREMPLPPSVGPGVFLTNL